MYRVYDLQDKRFLKEDIYLSPNPYSDLYVLKRGFLGIKRLILASDERYIIHKEIGICDKNGKLIYEGDIVEAETLEGKTFIGLVTYASEFSAYIILRYNPDEYYILGDEVSGQIKIIGNVLDNNDLLEEYHIIDKEIQDGKQYQQSL